MLNLQTATVDQFTFEVDAAGYPLEACSRCGGYGRYSHNGETDACYDCTYNGRPPWHHPAVVNTRTQTVEQARAAWVKVLKRRAADRARREAKAAAKWAEKQTKMDAIRAANEALLEQNPLAVDATYYPNFLAAAELADEREYNRVLKAVRGYSYVSDHLQTSPFNANTVEWAGNATARLVQWANDRQAEDASASPAPLGRVQVVGTVVYTKVDTQVFGYNERVVYKMLVKADAGWKVWVSVPQSLFSQFDGPVENLKGSRVEFTATLELGQQNPDPTFVFGSRPTKARLLAAATS